MGIRILHTADLHLGAEYKSFHQKNINLQHEAFNAFEKLINYVIDPFNGIDILIIAGDLFDIHSPEIPLAEKVKKLLLKVTGKNIKLYILPGNHDSYSYKNSIYRTFEFPGRVIKNPDFQLIDEIRKDDQTIYIYSGIYELNNPGKRIIKDFKVISNPGTHIGILHGTLELQEIKISERNLPFSYDEFTDSGLNYLALGHFHSYMEKGPDTRHKLAYPGSLLPRSIDEYGDKYALVTEISPDNSIRIEALQFSKIKVEKKIISSIKEEITDMYDLINLLKKSENPLLILDLYLEGVLDFPVNEKYLSAMAEDYFFYIRINNNIKFIKASLINQLKDEETIRGIFFKKMLEKASVMSSNKQNIINQAINLGLRDFTHPLFSYKPEEPDYKKDKSFKNRTKI